MGEKPFNEDRLSEKLHAWIENSHYDRVIEEGSEEIDAWARHVAETILRGARDAVSDDTVRQAQARLQEVFRLPEEDVRRHFAGWAIDNRIGEATVGMQATAERRFQLLVTLGKEALVDWRTHNYLWRATQCYLFGLDEQCVIMCRSALEASFFDAVPDTVCIIHFPRKLPRRDQAKPEYGLADRIKAAEKEKIIDSDLAKAARFVKEKANDVIHPDREASGSLDPKETELVLFATINAVKSIVDKTGLGRQAE